MSKAQKYHKVPFTSEQLGSILQACEWAINDEYSLTTDPTNAHYMRIIKKIAKELHDTEPGVWRFEDEYLN
ncbi:MAG: hypothetical protein VZR31_07765 [Lachnospiraceae bacterium]|nr:hypothetical protein [Lachnospiraceae bacterium]